MTSMPLPLIRREHAQKAWDKGIPFRIRVEFQGTTGNGNASDKWWEIWLRAPNDWLRCNYGRTGSRGLSEPLVIDFPEAMTKLREKLAKGYRYVAGTLDGLPGDPPVRMWGVTEGSLSHLPEPFSKIAIVAQTPDGLWQALDADHQLVVMLDKDGLRELGLLGAA